MSMAAKMRKQLFEMKAEKGAAWKTMQKIWTIDFLVGIAAGIASAFATNRFSNPVFISVLFSVLLVAYVLLWVDRSGRYKEKYAWWKGWMTMCMAPYGFIMFVAAYVVTLLVRF